MSEQLARRVLIVDDDPLARHALGEIFQRNGMQAILVGDGASALAEILRQTPDLCVVDVILPDISGIQLIGQIRRRPDFGRVAVLGITSRRDPQILLSAFTAGADDFVFKPVSGEELLIRATLAVARRRGSGAIEGVSSQRREMTALFCDVRGFTAIAATMDPEWVVEVLNALFEMLVTDVTRFGGYVDKFLGDGLLAFFGMREALMPREHCAIQAALAMIQSAATYGRDSLVLGGRKIGVGVGIATGQVVIAPVGSVNQRQITAIGDAVNLASRLQALATEGEILVCSDTYRRVAESVDIGSPREVEIKGVAGIPTIWPVKRLRPEGFVG